jgi:hypothetical protein
MSAIAASAICSTRPAVGLPLTVMTRHVGTFPDLDEAARKLQTLAASEAST